MSLKANIVANYLGQGWRTLMSLAFVPLYIKYLGIEAYGVIGLFATFLAWLGILDFSLRPVLGREMARFTGGALDAQSLADVLRSVEIVGLAIAIAFAAALYACAGWLATEWVNAGLLPTATVSNAFALMGVVGGLQLIEGLYGSALAGLQRQVLQNSISSFVVSLRVIGAVAVLHWVSPTLEAFFIWQAIASAIGCCLSGAAVYLLLPARERMAQFVNAGVILYRRAGEILHHG